MLIRNDVALLTFVPFTIMLLKMAKREDLFITVIVLQTIGANLGSMLTPIGNPQNLYLYSLYEIPMVKFLLTMLPLTVAAFLLLMFFVFRIKAEDYTIKNLVLPKKTKSTFASFVSWSIFALFKLCVAFAFQPCNAVADFVVYVSYPSFFAFKSRLQIITYLCCIFHFYWKYGENFFDF